MTLDFADQNDSNLRKRNCNSAGWSVSCEAIAKIAIDAKIGEIEKQELTAETREPEEDWHVPFWEMLRGGETNG